MNFKPVGYKEYIKSLNRYDARKTTEKKHKNNKNFIEF